MTEEIKVTKYSTIDLIKQDGESEVVGNLITAYVTTYGNEDVVKDVVEKGAADKFVANFDGSLPMLLNHDVSQIIGVWTKFESDDYGLKGYGELNETTLGKDVQMLIKDGMLADVSIGFRAIDYELKDNGGRLFKEIDLFETSVVLFPANRRANITSVKDEDGRIDIRKLESILRDVKLTQKERKLLLAGGVKELMKQRDVLSVEHSKQSIVTNLIGVLK